MEKLFEIFYRRLAFIPLKFKRSLLKEINWEDRLIAIRGGRGVGKTTLLLQYIKENLPLDRTTLYVSLDNIWFADNKLTELADNFVKHGGRFLFLDEVHHYPKWAQEIKNLYDDYPDLNIVFTGPSLLEILDARADLSRRAVSYTMQGLSFREYLNLTTGQHLPVYSLVDLWQNAPDITQYLNTQIKPLQHFETYIQQGYYPFFRESEKAYPQRLEEVIRMILEIELPLLRKVETSYIHKLKQLLQIIAVSVPFKPNITKLSARIGINRNTLITYLSFLEEARLTNQLYKEAKGITKLQKPEKIYLGNPNLAVVLAQQQADTGNLRETFFINQTRYIHEITYSSQSDFVIDGQYTVEVGGKNKTGEQIKSIDNSFIAADNIEYATPNQIPLWLFGFLY